jgi:hypothetical protein
MFHLNRLGTCSSLHMTKQKSIKPWWFILPQSSCIIFIPHVNFVFSQAWLWQLLLSWLSLPSLLLAFTCNEYEIYSCIQLLKTKLFQRLHYKFLCMVFQTIPSKFSCASFRSLQNTSYFVTLFLAHEDVVVGFVIFHTKLSTPQLACFICSSLILQGSWSDHYNLKKGTPPWYEIVGRHPKDSVSHGLWKERLGGVPNFIKEHVNANFSILRTARNLFSMEDSKNSIAIRWQEQPPPKTIFYFYFINEKL